MLQKFRDRRLTGTHTGLLFGNHLRPLTQRFAPPGMRVKLTVEIITMRQRTVE